MRPLSRLAARLVASLFFVATATGFPVQAPLYTETTPQTKISAEPPSNELEDTHLPAETEGMEPQAELAELRSMAANINSHRRRGDYHRGLSGARAGLVRAETLGNLPLQIEFLYLLGRIAWNLSDYPQSLQHHLRELRLAEQHGDAFLLARTHGGLGLTLHRYGSNEEALQHFTTGLEFARQAGDDRIRASLLNSLGNLHLGAGDYDRAAALHDEALRLREGYGNRRAIAESLTNLGLVAEARGDPDTALSYLQKALSTFESLRYRRYIANTHRRLAMVLRKSGRLDEALGHLQAATEIAATIESAEVFADIHEEFTHLHEARGDFAAALQSQRKHAEAMAQMRGERDRQIIEELRAHYGAEQRELEIALLKRDQQLQAAELHQRRSQTLALAAGLVGGITLLGSVIVVQLIRLRTARRLHAATEHAKEQAEVAERMKSHLLQIASHDLKVPLAALNATAHLIAQAPGDAPTVTRLASGIQADTARMRNLVRDFLDAAAIEEGNLQVHTVELDLACIARAAVDSLGPIAVSKGQDLRFEEPIPSLPSVEADAERLRQVFDNLIGNALKFTPHHGRITIAFGITGGWAFAEVRDTGPGLGPADFAKIFTPQQRLSAQPTGDEHSSGLGLFIARELLTRQGGRLEVQSQPHQGATFRVLLPIATRVV